jgi:hypothetical protein
MGGRAHHHPQPRRKGKDTAMLNIPENRFSDSTSITLGIATGGATDVKLKPTLFSWESFKNRLRSPRIGDKGGSYYIRGGDLIENKRSDENLRIGELIILDGDSSFDPETGEIVNGAPDLNKVCAALEEMGITFCAHTSHSYVPDKLWKYRIIIPAKLDSGETLTACVAYLIDSFVARGIHLADVPENHRWSQPWFTSRVRDRAANEEFLFFEHTGAVFDSYGAVLWNDARVLAAEATAKARAPAAGPVEKSGAIAEFNDSHGLEWVRSELESAGYRFGYFDRAHDAYRYMRPGSSTKTFGLVVFKGSMGHWCTYSHHGSADRLSCKVCDPFQLVAELRYGGDLKAAAAGVLQKVAKPSVVEQLAQRAEKRNLERELEAYSLGDVEEAPTGAPIAPSVIEPKRRIELIKWGELRDEPVRWTIKDILPANSFCALYGHPGSYKSFAAFYLACCIAGGLEAFGKPSVQGPVIYIALEGGAGLKRRRDALKQSMGLPDDLPLYFIKTQLNLGSTLEDRDAVVAEIKRLGVKPSLVIIDTFARATPGLEENSAKDVGGAITIMSSLQDDLGCGVLIIHHSGKDQARGMRGSSALLGAVDLELECQKISQEGSADRIGKLTVTKQKDGEDGIVLGYRMDVIALSQIDPEATSLALVPIAENELADASKVKGAKENKTGVDAKIALEALHQAVSEGGDVPPIGDRAPRGTKAVREALWRDYWRKTTTKEGGAERTGWARAKENLTTTGRAAHWGEWWWIVKQEEAPPNPFED